MTKQTAKEVYASAFADLMADIDHMKHECVLFATPPGAVTWADVGDLRRCQRLAGELRDLLRGEVK